MFTGHEGRVRGVAWGPVDSRPIVASAGQDATVRLWDAATGLPDKVLTGHSGWVRGVAVGGVDEDVIVASAGDDGTVRLWDAGNGEQRATLTGHDGHVRAVAFGVVGARAILASAGDDGTVRLWDVASGAREKVLTGHEGHVRRVAFGEIARRPVIASVGEDGAVRLWDVEDGASRGTLTTPGSGVWRLAFGEVDGRQMIAVAGEDVVWLSDPATDQLQATLTGHVGRVRGVAFGGVDDPPMVASAGEDGTVRLWDPPPQPAEALDWLSDAPARRDQLRREQLADKLAQRVRQMRRDDRAVSFLIHVDGPWGSGKTTLLGFLRTALEGQASVGDRKHGARRKDDVQREQSSDDWMVVSFDAWRRSRVGPPWWALMTSLRDAIVVGPPRRRWLRFEEILVRLRRSGAPYLLALLLLVVVAIGVLVVVRPSSPSAKDVGDVAHTIAAVVATLATLSAGALVVTRFLLWDSATGARIYEQSQQNPMEGLADHFAWLLTKARARVVFFIDDLDRCDGTYVVELLDAIQTLVRDSPRRLPGKAAFDRAPYFVVAADGAWIRQSYEARYEDFQNAVREPGRGLGYLFLDKIFQLTVTVPTISPGQQESYLKVLLKRDEAKDEVDVSHEATARQRIEASRNESDVLSVLKGATAEVRAEVAPAAVAKLSESEVGHATEHALQKFAGLLEPNPRAMKRFVNTYDMARAVAVLEDHLVAMDPLALWTILRMRWPELADHLRSHPDKVDPPAVAGNAPSTASGPVESLLDVPEVKRVLEFQSGMLTSQVIRELSGSAPAA